MEPEQKQEAIKDPNMTLGSTKIIPSEAPPPPYYPLGIKKPVVFYASGLIIIAFVIFLIIALVIRIFQIL